MGEEQAGSPVRFVLAADDYALSHGVCDGIEKLIAAHRLSATGAMTIFPEWLERASGLKALAEAHAAEVGLHLTLTDQTLLTAPFGSQRPGIGALLQRSHLGALNRHGLEREIAAQLDRFEDAYGEMPAFIDGHQHVHLLPGVRGALIGVLLHRYPDRPKPWIRSCADPAGAILHRPRARGKGLLLSWLDRGLARMARTYGLKQNHGFRGVYDFAQHADYAAIFPTFLKPSREGLLVHCHPGIPDTRLTERDGLINSRASELAYFASDAFPELLERKGMRLARLGECRL